MNSGGGDTDGFLSRWSRRKQETAIPATEEVEPSVDPDIAPPEPTDPSETDEQILARLGLPDPDTLEKGDDFAVYLRAPLPQHIRRRALRRLWRSNPVLANLDGLNDYDDDFTGDSVPLGTLRTAYKVGRGLLRPEAEDRIDDEEIANAEVLATEADPMSDATTMAPVDVPMNEDVPDTMPDAPDTEVTSGVPTRRRMAFRFTDES
jgi:hypothetical protein